MIEDNQDNEDLSFFCNANNLITNVVKSTFTIRPVAVIVYGTPGSGKSRILHHILKEPTYYHTTRYWSYLLKNADKPDGFDEASMGAISQSEENCGQNPSLYGFNIVPILHDEILNNIPSYKSSLEPFKESILKIHSDKIEDYSIIAGHFNKLYQKYKNYVYLVTSYLIDCCLANRRNILIETTGNDLTYIEETIKKIKGNGYYVVCLFPYVKLQSIYNRVIDRSKICGRIISKPLLTECYKNSFNNFFRLSNKCDEVYMLDLTTSFGEKSLLYHKRYENYKIVCEQAYNLDKVYNYMQSIGVKVDLGRLKTVIKRL